MFLKVLLRRFITLVCFVSLVVNAIAPLFAQQSGAAHGVSGYCEANDACCESRSASFNGTEPEACAPTRIRALALSLYHATPSFAVDTDARTHVAGKCVAGDSRPDHLASTLRRTYLRHSVWLI